MKRYLKQIGGAKVLIEEIQTDPEPLPCSMNSEYLFKVGFKSAGHNTYAKDLVTIRYDGCYWEVFFFCATFRIETIEEFEKLIA